MGGGNLGWIQSPPLPRGTAPGKGKEGGCREHNGKGERAQAAPRGGPCHSDNPMCVRAGKYKALVRFFRPSAVQGRTGRALGAGARCGAQGRTMGGGAGGANRRSNGASGGTRGLVNAGAA